MESRELQLYQSPFIDPLNSKVVRLLFESPSSEKDPIPNFYLYVWLNRDNMSLESFQAVLNNQLSYTWRSSGHRHIGEIGREPINRVIRGVTDMDDNAENIVSFKEFFSAITQTHFNHLLRGIEGIVNGQVTAYDLHDDEKECFQNLL